VLLFSIAKFKINQIIEKDENLQVNNYDLSILSSSIGLSDVAIKDYSFLSDSSHIQEITIERVSLYKLLFKKKLKIKSIKLTNADLHLKVPEKSDSTNKKPFVFLFEYIEMDSVNLEIELKKSSLDISNITGNLSNISDQTIANNDLDIFEIETDAFKFIPNSGSHDIITDKLKLNNKSIDLEKVEISPKCGIDQWTTCFLNKKGRVTYAVNTLSGDFTDQASLEGIFLDTVDLIGGHVTLYSYEDVEPSMDPREFFMEKFDNIDIPINIPILALKEHKVSIFLKAEAIDTIYFTDIYASIYNVVNVDSLVSQNNKIKVNTISKFMNKSKLDVSFGFNIDDPKHAYEYTLNLDPIEFSNFNKALYYNTPISIEDGTLNILECQVTGDNVFSEGSCALAYKDFKIQLANDKGRERKIPTAILNLLIKDKIPKYSQDEPKTFTGELEREPSKDFFFHLYSIILEIIKGAVTPF